MSGEHPGFYQGNPTNIIMDKHQQKTIAREMILQRALQMKYEYQQIMQSLESEHYKTAKPMNRDRCTQRNTSSRRYDHANRTALSISNISAITSASKLSMQRDRRHRSDPELLYETPLNSTRISEMTTENNCRQNSRCDCQHNSHSSSEEAALRLQTRDLYQEFQQRLESLYKNSTLCNTMQTQYSTGSSSNPQTQYSAASSNRCDCGEPNCNQVRSNTEAKHYASSQYSAEQTRSDRLGSTGSSVCSTESHESISDAPYDCEEVMESMHSLSLAVNTSFTVCEYDPDDMDDFEDQDSRNHMMDSLSPNSTMCKSSIWNSESNSQYEKQQRPHPSFCSSEFSSKIHNSVMAGEHTIENVLCNSYYRNSPEGKEFSVTPVSRSNSSSLVDANHLPSYQTFNSETDSVSHHKRSIFSHSAEDIYVPNNTNSSCKFEKDNCRNLAAFPSNCSSKSLDGTCKSSSSNDKAIYHGNLPRHNSGSKSEKKVKKHSDKKLNATHLTACSDVSRIANARFCKGPIGKNCLPTAVDIGKQSILKKIKKLSKKISSSRHLQSTEQQHNPDRSSFKELAIL